VPDAQEIVDSDKYKKWAEGATAETKALLRSDDPADFVSALHKYKRSVARKPKKKAPDEDKKKKKKAHDELHGSTLRQAGKGGGGESSAAEDDFDGAFDEATKKDEKQ
jgi:hypothetical protein